MFLEWSDEDEENEVKNDDEYEEYDPNNIEIDYDDILNTSFSVLTEEESKKMNIF
jgi:hypothetical protein